MPTTTTNVSFQKWADNEEPWEQRTDWDKLDDIFSGVTTVPIFNGTATANAFATDDLVDGGGVSHTGRLSDLGELFQAAYDKTVGGGSVTDNQGVIQIREPGNASAQSGSRIYHHLLGFDTTATRRIRVNLSNITIDNQTSARIQFVIRDTPDAVDLFSGDVLGAQVLGDGQVAAVAINGGSNSTSTDSTQDNAYVQALNYIQFDWDGSTVTVETNDGTTTITESVSSNYPTTGTLFLTLRARDRDNNNARNVDFDIDDVVVSN